MREKLIELLEDADHLCNVTDCDDCLYVDERRCVHKLQVDHLIANGVTVSEKGEWNCLEAEIGYYACTLCDHRILRAKCNFCPNCGADMR